MKLSRLMIFVNIVIFVIAGIIALPSINTNIGGREINIDTSPIKKAFQGRFENIRIENSRDFMKQQLFVLEMASLNAQPAEGETAMNDEEKQKIFDSNFEIIRKRIELMGFSDYDMRKVKNEEGKYFIEIELPDNQINSGVLGTLITEGEYTFYEFDENYKAPEGEDAQPTSFLDGKKPSELLSFDDVVQITHYFNNDVVNSADTDPETGEQKNQKLGGWAIKIDFGEENIDKVALTAADANNFSDFYRRLWIVQGQFPVAIQIGPILRDVNNEAYQSEIIFASFISQTDPNSYIYSLALANSFKTEPVNTSIIISSTQSVEPLYGAGTVEILKVVLISALLVIVIVSAIVFKSKGLILGGSIVAQSIIAVAIAKLISASLTIALIWGMISGLIFFSILIIKYLVLNSKDLEKGYDRFRRNYWIAGALLLAVCVIAALALNSILLNGILGFAVSLIAGLIVFEVSFKTLVAIFNSRK
jgi:preprotein translocase subunit SecD